MSLQTYHQKRRFTRTSEPRGRVAAAKGRSFVVQKHAASRLHYDFRLEHRGVLLSWACPKGPSLDPTQKRLAVHVEDHPVDYGSFEGTIPAGEYGGGTVMLWDRGTWRCDDPDADAAYRKGHLRFTLEGRRLRGGWHLVRMHGRRSGDKENWLLMKADDQFARPGDADALLEQNARSVKTGRTMEEIAAGRSRRVGRALRFAHIYWEIFTKAGVGRPLAFRRFVRLYPVFRRHRKGLSFFQNGWIVDRWLGGCVDQEELVLRNA